MLTFQGQVASMPFTGLFNWFGRSKLNSLEEKVLAAVAAKLPVNASSLFKQQIEQVGDDRGEAIAMGLRAFFEKFDGTSKVEGRF